LNFSLQIFYTCWCAAQGFDLRAEIAVPGEPLLAGAFRHQGAGPPR
jgi:hypothetical protein